MMNMEMRETNPQMEALREKISFVRKCAYEPLFIHRLYTYYIEKTINYPLYRWVVLVLTLALCEANPFNSRILSRFLYAGPLSAEPSARLPVSPGILSLLS